MGVDAYMRAVVVNVRVCACVCFVELGSAFVSIVHACVCVWVSLCVVECVGVII